LSHGRNNQPIITHFSQKTSLFWAKKPIKHQKSIKTDYLTITFKKTFLPR